MNNAPEIDALLKLAEALGACTCVFSDSDAAITLTNGREIEVKAERDNDDHLKWWTVTLTARVEDVPHDPVELGERYSRLLTDTALLIAAGLNGAKPLQQSEAAR